MSGVSSGTSTPHLSPRRSDIPLQEFRYLPSQSGDIGASLPFVPDSADNRRSGYSTDEFGHGSEGALSSVPSDTSVGFPTRGGGKNRYMSVKSSDSFSQLATDSPASHPRTPPMNSRVLSPLSETPLFLDEPSDSRVAPEKPATGRGTAYKPTDEETGQAGAVVDQAALDEADEAKFDDECRGQGDTLEPMTRPQAFLRILLLILHLDLHCVVYCAILIGVITYKAWVSWVPITFPSVGQSIPQGWGNWADGCVNNFFVLGYGIFFMIVMFGFRKCKPLFLIVLPFLLLWSVLYDFFFFYFKIEVDFQGYPHYVVYGIVFIATGLVMARYLQLNWLKVNFIVPELILPIMLLPYDFFLLPWAWDLQVDAHKILARIFIHPVYMEVIGFVMRFFSRRLRSDPRHTFILACQIQALSSFYGRLTLTSLQDSTLEIITSVVIGILEVALRLTGGQRDELIYRIWMGKEKAREYFARPSKRILTAQLTLSEIMIEDIAIIISPLLVWFFQVPTNGVLPNINDTMVSISYQLAIEFGVDILVLTFGRWTDESVLESWDKRAPLYWLFFGCSIYIFQLYFLNSFTVFVRDRKGIYLHYTPW